MQRLSSHFVSIFIVSTQLIFANGAIAAQATGARAVAPTPVTSAVSKPSPMSSEDWKGPSDPAKFHLGVLTGMGVLDSKAGFALLGTASAKIVQRGFVPDINNSVSIETELGPLFVASSASFMYSAHLRWDFEKDELWTFYALGGFSGHITGSDLGSRFIFFPRFGVGTICRLHELFALRAEVSRELIAAGVIFSF